MWLFGDRGRNDIDLKSNGEHPLYGSNRGK